MDIIQLLTRAKEMNASDLHISVNSAPVYRIHGELVLEGESLWPADTEEMGRYLMSEGQWQTFCGAGEVDFSYSVPGTSRYRVNVYRQRGCISIAARIVPNSIPKFESLGIPEVIRGLTDKPHGLVLVTGPTGSGKSTTLAAMIDHINHSHRRHIITLEDPIEYLHKHDLSVIDQREIGLDTHGFGSALRAALRQDPDVILVGELRDLETISTALTAAETGHLVFATLHTSDAVSTIDRIIDVFPATQQPQVRIQIASVLQGVAAQRLYQTLDGKRRVAAVEVLINTPAVANLIRTEKTHQIRSVMQTGRAFGMQTMDNHLRDLAGAGILSPAIAQQWGSVGSGVI